MIETGWVCGRIDDIISLNNFKAFHKENVADKVLDIKVLDIIENRIRVSDNAAIEIVNKIYNKKAITNLPEMPRYTNKCR